MLDSERHSVMSNEFIVGNMHWNVHLKSDPRSPGHKP